MVCAAALTGVRASANQSVVLAPGTSGTFTVPSSAPFDTLGDTRVELRLHDWSVPSSNTRVLEIPGVPVFLTAQGELCVDNRIDASPAYGGEMCADITGQTDLVMRVQRDTANKLFKLEVRTANQDWTATTYCGYKANGTQGNQFPCPIGTVNLRSWGGTGTVGDTGTAGKLAWVKWFSGVVPTGTPMHEMASADLADWRFEGNGNDTSGHQLNISIQASYTESPRYAPVCAAGQQLVFRAGFRGTLDATSSYPLNGSSTVAYFWQQLSGPSTVFWSSRSAARPDITGMVFGSYVFQLTVTDSNGQSTACTVKHGAVASDDNGVVITANPTVDVILGPLIRYGANPWPWYDDRHKAAADMQIANLSRYYLNQDGLPYWDVPGTGTVTVTTGSTEVSGAGTAFTTTFCQGPGSVTTPKSGATIIVWYPTTYGGQQTTGRQIVPISSCTDDTHMTLTKPWGEVSDGSGLNYLYGNDNVWGMWIYGPAPQNYYDNVMGFYSLYYRTGIDDYLTAARRLADLWWRIPNTDRGRMLGDNSLNAEYTFPPRSQSTTGLVLRALDGKPEMWAGLHKAWDRWMWYLDIPDASWGVWDLREMGYHLTFVSLCGLFDPDETYRNTCRAAVSRSFERVWTPLRASDGGWEGLMSTADAWTPASTTATLEKGSTLVTGNGTSWSSAQFVNGALIWFTANSAKPRSNADGDPVTYSATWMDGTHLTLDRLYEGENGLHGWVLGYKAYPEAAVGFGQSPFSMGLLSTAFDFAQKAIADSDPGNSALAGAYRTSAVDWVRNYGYWPAKKGMYYFAQYANCQHPIGDSNAQCTAGNNESQSRTLSAETIRGIGAAYLNSRDEGLKVFGDSLYSAMFSKPGTGGPAADGYYVSDLEDGRGWYMIGTPPAGQSPKWFGQFFGYGALSTWPAYRLGGPQPEARQTVVVGFDREAIPNVRQVRITITAPSGTTTRTVCDISPCQVSVDGRQGDHLMALEYLGAQGDRAAAGEAAILAIR
jgi:hypothetical protein